MTEDQSYATLIAAAPDVDGACQPKWVGEVPLGSVRSNPDFYKQAEADRIRREGVDLGDRARCIRITALQFAGQVETSADGLVEAAAKIEAFIRNGKTEATPTSN